MKNHLHSRFRLPFALRCFTKDSFDSVRRGGFVAAALSLSVVLAHAQNSTQAHTQGVPQTAAQRDASSFVQSDAPKTAIHEVPLDSHDPLISRGSYLARAGDCIACHTTHAGAPFAGGLALKTPFGAIYSTNITPDKTTGIGNYTYDDFAKALREGVAPGGRHLYPAMPYPSFSKINDEDMHALYAYFMGGVNPVPLPNHANGLRFPFNIRALMIGWNLLYRPAGIFQPDPSQSAEWNRGAYLVQGLEHCGACHTPHGITGQEETFDQKGNSSYLHGYNLSGWYAPNLRGDQRDGLGQWKTEEIVAFLRTGRTARVAAFGAMSEAIADSTQYLSDSDLTSIAVYLKSLSSGKPVSPGDKAVASNVSASPAAVGSDYAPLRDGRIASPGAKVYLNSCNACHRSDGSGAPGVFPSLAGNSAVQSGDPTSLIHIVLSGSHMPSTVTRPAPLSMPPFGWRLNDQQIADVLTFVRGSWGNRAASVSPDQVKKVRAGVRSEEATE
jgi:mono/diheme cytochrome c family protein